MKKFLPLIILLLMAFSCANDSNNQDGLVSEVIGTWGLEAVYYDPGDGSGDFEAVSSEKTVEFRLDGTVVSNGSLCSASDAMNEGSSGTYSMSESTITIEECGTSPYPITFEYSNSILIISYPCIEACQERYVKL